MSKTMPRAKFGAAAYVDLEGKLPAPYPRIMGPNAGKYVQEVVDSGLTVDMTGRFEKAFAQAMGVKHCICAPGCTPSLGMLMEALDFEPGDEVIYSPITDYGTIYGGLRANLIPVFADTVPGSVNISAQTIEPCITDRTRAIVCVHKTGIVCDMDPILALARKHKLVVIEDACQAVYSRYQGRLAGTFGDFGAFSFDSEKTMGSDIGGCLITNHDQYAEQIRFRCQSRGAMQKEGFGRLHTVAGSATRMPNCTAAICLAQLEIMEGLVANIDRVVRRLYERLEQIPGIRPEPIPAGQEIYSAWMIGFSLEPQAFTCDAEEFARQCRQRGIPDASRALYYLMPEACTFLEENARAMKYPYSMPPASRKYHYGAQACPHARAHLEHWVRWTSFCDKYELAHADLAAEIIRSVADANRA